MHAIIINQCVIDCSVLSCFKFRPPLIHRFCPEDTHSTPGGSVQLEPCPPLQAAIDLQRAHRLPLKNAQNNVTGGANSPLQYPEIIFFPHFCSQGQRLIKQNEIDQDGSCVNKLLIYIFHIIRANYLSIYLFILDFKIIT